MKIIKYRKIWFAISAALIALSLWSFFTYGFNTSIDFKGGTLTEVKFSDRQPMTLEEINQTITELNLGGFSVRSSGTNNFIIRTRELNQNEKNILIGSLGSAEPQGPTLERQTTIGPTAGAELKSKAVTAILVVIIMIVLFVTIAFRRVSKPVASWKYGLATIVALGHDVIIPTGIFVYLGYVAGIEIDLLFVTGLLAILGYSVHDTIVVFDRVRENLRVNQEKKINEGFETTVGNSVMQTMGRSINTSFTLLIVLIALYLVGSSATRDLTLLLTIGVIVGVYSSIFIASPLLVTFYKLQKR